MARLQNTPRPRGWVRRLSIGSNSEPRCRGHDRRHNLCCAVGRAGTDCCFHRQLAQRWRVRCHRTINRPRSVAHARPHGHVRRDRHRPARRQQHQTNFSAMAFANVTVAEITAAAIVVVSNELMRSAAPNRLPVQPRTEIRHRLRDRREFLRSSRSACRRSYRAATARRACGKTSAP